MSNKYIVGVGAANIDLHGKSKSAIIMRDSNPGYMHTSSGGVTRNIIENLARLGESTFMLSAIGEDAYGEAILRDSIAAGIDMSKILVTNEDSTSTYLAILDDCGDMLLGMSDMHILDKVNSSYLDKNKELIENAKAIVCDPCLPFSTLEILPQYTGNKAVFLDPVSTAYAKVIKPLIANLYCIKPNLMELEVLSGIVPNSDKNIQKAADVLLNAGVNQVVVSLGDKGAYWADDSGVQCFKSLKPVTQMVNATGAGDAFMAGLVHSYVNDFAVSESLDCALAAGIIALMSDKTINLAMSVAEIERQLTLGSIS